jgi:hypothetical protein
MKPSATSEQIAAALKQDELGLPLEEVLRRRSAPAGRRIGTDFSCLEKEIQRNSRFSAGP